MWKPTVTCLIILVDIQLAVNRRLPSFNHRVGDKWGKGIRAFAEILFSKKEGDT